MRDRNNVCARALVARGSRLKPVCKALGLAHSTLLTEHLLQLGDLSTRSSRLGRRHDVSPGCTVVKAPWRPGLRHRDSTQDANQVEK